MTLAVTRVKPVEKKKDKCLRPMVPLIILLKSLEYLVKSIGRVPEAVFKEDAGLPYTLIDVAADRSMIILVLVNIEVLVASVIALVLFHPHHEFFVDNFFSVFMRSY